MDEPNFDDFDPEDYEDFLPEIQTVEIPPIFHSDLEDAPFRSCNVCDRDLSDGEVPYVIEKSFRRYDNFQFQNTVFEYAICAPCTEMLQKSMSKESMEAVQNYFRENARMGDRFSKMMDEESELKWEDCIDTCIIKGTDCAECEEYQIVAQCQGNQMIVMHMPMMISGKAIEELSELLSQKTTDEMDDFMGNIGVPPELRELFSNKPILVF